MMCYNFSMNVLIKPCNGDVYDFYLWDNEEGFQEYGSIEEFSEKANIGGTLLKDLWGEIKKIEYDH